MFSLVVMLVLMYPSVSPARYILNIVLFFVTLTECLTC
jgi:hypothetical protein